MKFSRFIRAALVLVLPAALVGGCIFSPNTGGGGNTRQPYFPRTSPENVITDIQNAYINLDRVEYDSTLASDYVFRFQQADITQLNAPDSLIRAEELTFAENLFTNGYNGQPAASKIALTITIGSKDDDNRIGHSGWKKYNVTTALAITFPDGNQTTVNSPATFYFRQEPAITGLWVFAEWQDQPGSTAPIRLAYQ
jgi:hypothetical protein